MNKRWTLITILILCSMAGISALTSTAYMKSRNPFFAPIKESKATPHSEKKSSAAGKKGRTQSGSPAFQAPRAAAGQTATLLADGSWLLLGGEGSGDASSAAVIVKMGSGERITLVGGLQRARSWHSATMLPDGNILICGGIGSNGRVVNEVELFNPETKQFEFVPSNGLTPRAHHTATLLTDGTVLFVGGIADKKRLLDGAELWKWKTKVVTQLPTVLQTARLKHTATLLANGNVLLKGGVTVDGLEIRDNEQYELSSRSFAPAAGISDEAEAGTYVAESLPVDGAADVPVETNFVLRFSRPVHAETVTTESVSLTGSDGAAEVKTVVAESGRLLFVSPRKPLLPGATYTLLLANITDATGLPVPGTSLTITTVNEHTHDHMDENDRSTRNAQPPDEDEWLPDESNLQGNWRSRQPDSSFAQLPPLKAETGITALAGQVLTLKGRPLANVTLQIGNNSARTDETGRFLLSALTPGKHGLIINGSTASTPNRPFAMFDTMVEIKAGHTNVLPYTIWLPIIDKRNITNVPAPAPNRVTAKTPRIPGLEVQLPAGAVLRYPHGGVLKNLTITPMPVDRPPFPLPAGASNGILFTLQLHGARVGGASKKGDGIRIIYPNFAHLPPGSRIDLWNYDSREVGWYVYGRGTVTSDGQQIVPDPGAELQSMHCVTFAGNAPGPGPAPGNCCNRGGDPVDLSTGQFEYTKTDLYLPDVIPIGLSRTYRSNDTYARAFGIGSTHAYDIFLAGAPYSFLYTDLILPDGGRIHFDRISAGTGYQDAVYEHTATPTAFYKSRITWNNTLRMWELKLIDGTLMRFNLAQGGLMLVQDRYGNSVKVIREFSTNAVRRVAKIISTNGRWIEFTYDANDRIIQAKDNISRVVGYQYDASGRLWKVTDAGNGVTEYLYDTSHRMLTIKDPKNIVYLTNEYDTSGRVKKQTQADSGTYQFAYTVDANGKITQTDVTDPRDIIRRVTFNTSGYTTSNINALGKPEQQTISFERQAGTNSPLAVTDPLGRRTTYVYNIQGNATSITRMADTAAAATTTLTYEPVYNQIATITDPLNHTITYDYDSKDNLTSTTDALNHQTVLDYNAAGQVISVTDPLQHTAEFIYESGDLVEVRNPLGQSSKYFLDGGGRVLSITDSLGHTAVYEYDALNQIKKITDPLQGITSFDYDPNGNLLSVTDARNKLTSYTYNNMDRVETRTDPMFNVEHYEYDLSGNLKKHTDRRGKVTRYTYDNLDRPKVVGFGETVNGGTTSYESTIEYTSDAGNRLTQALDSQAGTLTRTYNDITRTYSETTPQGTIIHTYDAGGRLSTMTATGQTAISYSYDDADRLTGITQGMSSIGFGYDNANRRTSLTLPNAVIADYSYNDASQLTAISYARAGVVLGDLSYEYDAAGRRTKMGGSFARTVSPQSLSSAAYNGANQQSTFSNRTLIYDLNGNLTSDGANTYTWNARNQLASISGSMTASFQYDAFGRRISKIINGAATGYLYDGSNIVQEQAGGSATANMLSGGVDEVFSRSDAAGSWNMLRDGLGSTLALADSSGAVQSEYSYDGFGGTTSTGQTSNNSSQYTGRENDGTGLYYNRARYYSPQLQRFISEDPIGMAGGINLYAYVGNNPISFSDPSGLDKSDLSWRFLAHGAQFSAGFGDTITAYPAQFALFLGPGSVTGTIRGWTPGAGAVDPSSGSYIGGQVAGVAWGIAMAFAGGANGARNAVNPVEEWLGPGTRVITNPAGDKVFLSADKLRRVRFDINRPSPHINPHAHVEECINGVWKKSGPIYPTDVPHN